MSFLEKHKALLHGNMSPRAPPSRRERCGVAMEALLQRQAERIQSLEQSIAELDASHRESMITRSQARDEARHRRISAMLEDWLPLSDLSQATPEVTPSVTGMSSSSSTASSSVRGGSAGSATAAAAAKPSAARARFNLLAAQMKESKYSRGR